MSGLAITLLVVGGLLQFVGIVAIAWPDLLPWKERASAWLRRMYRRFETRLRRLFGRRPRDQTVSLSGGVSVGVSVGGTAVVSVAEEASMERKVAFLLQRDHEAQQKENKFAARLDDLEKALTKRLDELRTEMRSHQERKLAEELNRYRPLRILGTVLLAIGLGCQVAGSLI